MLYMANRFWGLPIVEVNSAALARYAFARPWPGAYSGSHLPGTVIRLCPTAHPAGQAFEAASFSPSAGCTQGFRRRAYFQPRSALGFFEAVFALCHGASFGLLA